MISKVKPTYNEIFCPNCQSSHPEGVSFVTNDGEERVCYRCACKLHQELIEAIWRVRPRVEGTEE